MSLLSCQVSIEQTILKVVAQHYYLSYYYSAGESRRREQTCTMGVHGGKMSTCIVLKKIKNIVH